MKKLKLSAVLLTAASLTLGASIASAELAPTIATSVDNGASARLVLHAEPGNINELRDTIIAYGGQIHHQRDDLNWIAASFIINAGNAQALYEMPFTNFVEADAQRASAPTSIETFDAHSAGPSPQVYRWDGDEAIPYGIDMVQAFGFAHNAAGAKKVCIIDTGYNINHPDLQTSKVDGEDEGAGPWNQDGNGHGTHVAGTIAAMGGNLVDINFNGVVGVINSDADLHIVRVFDAAGGFVYASDLAGAIQDCADAGSSVVSMSLGGALESKAEEMALKKVAAKGVLLVAAAGNNGYARHSYPASYDSVMSVAAIDQDMNQAPFSQRTAQVEIAAPGVNVLSTYDDWYAFLSGTSMATPHVSAVAALVWSHFPKCNAVHIRNALTRSALDIGDAGYDYRTGHGLVQTQAAYDYLNKRGCK